MTYDKKEKENNNLSISLKKNLRLRKKQAFERNDKKIIGKRTTKLGISQLNFTINEK
jgi:hypothetical protein